MGAIQKPVQFFKSLYSDPFKWCLVKSAAFFVVAIYVAREMAVAEKAAQLAPGTL